MIIVQTPLRIGLIGGGTDLPSFYERGSGYVLNVAIDKYVYVILKERFDDLIYVNYSKKEIVERLDDLQHDLVREAMRRTGVLQGVEITTLADIPTEGTGLGSSERRAGRPAARPLHLPGAAQAQGGARRRGLRDRDRDAAAARSGSRTSTRPPTATCDSTAFTPAARSRATGVEADPSTRRRLSQNLMLLYTEQQRRAAGILKGQVERADVNLPSLRRLRDMALEARIELERGNVDVLGEMLHANWELKRDLADGITNPAIDEMYDRARGPARSAARSPAPAAAASSSSTAAPSSSRPSAPRSAIRASSPSTSIGSARG